jgi:hypothetical protein
MSGHGRAPFRQQLLFRLDVGGSMKLKIGTLLVASTLLDLTPSTALHAQFRASKPIELQQANSSECAIVRATDTDHRDPTYKITVTLDFSPNAAN